MAEPRISLSPPLIMEGRRRVGRRSHARPECRLRLVEAIGHPAARAVRRRAIQRHAFVATGQLTSGNLVKLGVPH